MATNDFKPFATGSGANVLSQADYEALAALASGFLSGKAWIKLPEKTKEELIATAENKRNSLISTSMQSISFIQLKLQAGRQLSESEENKLNAVIDYIDALSAVETKTAPDIDWPELTV